MYGLDEDVHAMLTHFQRLEKPRRGTSKGWKCSLFALLFAVSAHGASPWRESLAFTITTNIASDRSVYVVGNHPDLGNWSPTAAVMLAYAGSNVWRGHVAVQAGSAIEYRYISRLDASNQFCVVSNVEWLGAGNLTTSTPAQIQAPYTGKTMFYLSSWTSATVRYWANETTLVESVMSPVGEGRVSGEYLYRAAGFGVEGEPVQFDCYGFLSGTQYWDKAPFGGFGSNDYFTSLDVFYLQDGDIFNYEPPPAPGGSVVVTQVVASSFSNIPARASRIYLPRGYSDNAWKRYPVLYTHDGQYFAGPWGAWPTLNREVGQGRVREAIVVAVETLAASNRCQEYVPPEDEIDLVSYCGTPNVQGIGDQYADYLIHDVKAFVDANYRTLADPANTGVIGSSLGGLISCWMAMKTNAFGLAGVMSAAFWTAPNFMDWIDTNDSHGATRLYFDFGTNEDASIWDYLWLLRYYLLEDGYAENGDLLTRVGCGHAHTEGAWAARLPGALRYLLGIRDEPNLLAQREYPPTLSWEPDGSAPTSLVHYTLSGFRYRLETASNLLDGVWSVAATSTAEALPWSQRVWPLTNGIPAAPTVFLRVSADGIP
ncbi:MAG: hypothetical protein J5I99_07585 [Verrucomicrobia bacterium]|nr:hypothetical protein [Verrucomicrobiota bacterium]